MDDQDSDDINSRLNARFQDNILLRGARRPGSVPQNFHTSHSFSNSNASSPRMPQHNFTSSFAPNSQDTVGHGNHAYMPGLAPFAPKKTAIAKPHFLVRQMTCVGTLMEGDFDIATVTLLETFLFKDDYVALVLTSRHAVNGASLKDLSVYFPLENWECSRLRVIEDGARIKQDYILFLCRYPKKSSERKLKILTDARNLPSHLATFYCANMSAAFKDNLPVVIRGTAQVSSLGQPLTWQSHLDTTPGFSGSPYFDSQGRLFGIHARGSAYCSISGGERSGILLSHLAQSGSPYFQFDSVNVNNALASYNKNYIFEDVSYSYLPGEWDESSARDHLMGSTPQLGSCDSNVASLQARQVLCRYWRDEKATKQGRLFSTNKFGFSLAELNLFLTMKSVRDFSKSPHKIRLNALDAFLSDKTDWEVRVDYKDRGTGKIYNGFKPLDQNNFISKKETAQNFDMGHKLGASDYWKEGAGPYITQRCDDIINRANDGYRQTKYGKATAPNSKFRQDLVNDVMVKGALRTGKRTELTDRYTAYMAPARDGYYDANGRKIRRQFMNESWNYHFQDPALNRSDGATDAADYLAPVGKVWFDDGKWAVNSKGENVWRCKLVLR